MEICPRCESYTLTTHLSSYCAVCNYSRETDVTLQPIYAGSLAKKTKVKQKTENTFKGDLDVQTILEKTV